MNRDVGFISGFLRSGSRLRRRPAPQRGERSWSCQSGSATGAARGRPRRRVGGAGGSSVGPRVAPARAALEGSSSSSSDPPGGPSELGGPPGASAPSSHRSISWVNETSLENRAPTDSPRWMRLMASPMSGATDRIGQLRDALRRRQRHGVGDDDLAQRALADALDGRVAQHAVRGAGVHLGDALALERAHDLDQRARRYRSRRRR